MTKSAGQIFCTLFLKQSKTIKIHQDYIYNKKMTVNQKIIVKQPLWICEILKIYSYRMNRRVLTLKRRGERRGLIWHPRPSSPGFCGF